MVRFEFTVHRRHLVAVTGLVVIAALLVPGMAWASNRFHDVPDSNVFSTDIEWLADAGITRGCNPPVNDEFCPGKAVTREQMAAFMLRLAQAGVVDAATLDGHGADSFARASHTSAVPIAGGFIRGSDGLGATDVHSWGTYTSTRTSLGRYSLRFPYLHKEIPCNDLKGSLPVFVATPSLFDTRVTMGVDGWACDPDTFRLKELFVLVNVYDKDGAYVDRSFSFIAYGAAD